MKNRLKNWIAISIIPQILIVKWFSHYPEVIDKYYSNGVYQVSSNFFRKLLGWTSVSIGDIVYALLIILAIRYIVIYFKTIRTSPKYFIRDILVVLSVTYFTFNVAWGLNYYRIPLIQNLSLKESYTETELLAITKSLIEKTNRLQYQLSKDTAQIISVPYSQKEIIEMTLDGYKTLEVTYPQLAYTNPSVKNSLFSTLLSFMGYGGYINPFTNEAQVNAKVPSFRYPVIAGHEIGHQLGYSAEDDVSFIGYLVTSMHEDKYLQYTAYAYAASYCLSEIAKRDKEKSKALYALFYPGVKKNFNAYYNFWRAYDTPLEPIFKNIFNAILKANHQKEGIRSYYKIVTYLVAYHLQNPIEL